MSESGLRIIWEDSVTGKKYMTRGAAPELRDRVMTPDGMREVWSFKWSWTSNEGSTGYARLAKPYEMVTLTEGHELVPANEGKGGD